MLSIDHVTLAAVEEGLGTCWIGGFDSDHVKKVLADIKRVCPDYDPKQSYELAGFVWFQGWNDMVDSSTYPNRGKPGGYDKYSDWLRVDQVSFFSKEGLVKTINKL